MPLNYSSFLPWKYKIHNVFFPVKAERFTVTPSPESSNLEFSYGLLWFHFSPTNESQVQPLPAMSAWTSSSQL